MIRAGRYGEYEDRFLTTSRIYLTWGETLTNDARSLPSRADVAQTLRNQWPDASEGRVRNHAAQIWAFLQTMKVDDLVVVPSKKKAELHFGVIRSDAQYDAAAQSDYRHYREVTWLQDVPRSAMDKDILYSLGAVMTICEISRYDAEARIRRMLKLPVAKSATPAAAPPEAPRADDSATSYDYEQLARDEIAALIIRRFKGHGMERLVEAILRAQGYETYRSPAGADRGIDILAGAGPLGFGSPKICVQVKSEQTPVDHPTFSQLLGTMQGAGADQGLLVAWGGFKTTVEREVPRHFFKVRLWDQKALLEQLFLHYDQLEEDIRAEIPLKRIWAIVPDETDESE
ncbi:MAG TPA: restriction endonuclease [Thermoanaerobaculia bacterium]|nr:restriction endonuclease [Thermoanaerobaculia bacterium]